MTQDTWFAASKEGLRKLVEHLPKSMVLHELAQNAWDENATRCDFTVSRIAGTPYVELACSDDDPDGFKDLTHAFTVWAESEKKANPSQAGRFNEGEKKVLALCRKAEISSTRGTVIFREDGTRTTSRRRTEKGSVFRGELRMTRREVRELERAFRRLIGPDDCETTYNGDRLEARKPVAEFETTLPTLRSDGEGVLRATRRKTMVRVYEPRDGEIAAIYELGIPVVETGDRFDVDVRQKVPLTRDRDNVPPAFLRSLRGAVLVETVDLLDQEAASAKWVEDGALDDAVDGDVLGTVLDARHGENRALYDGSDTEANKQLHGEGYEIIPRGSVDPELRRKILETGAGKKAGDIRPTPRPFSDDPDAPMMREIPPGKWSQGMREVADICRFFARELGICDDLLVRFGLPAKRWWNAAWGAGFTWNVSRLGRAWFDSWYEHPVALLSSIIHELSHEGAPDHLKDAFHRNCTRNGARMLMLALLQGKRIPHFRRILENHRRQGSRSDGPPSPGSGLNTSQAPAE